MKKYLYLLTICFLLFACGGNSDKEPKLSKKQIEYAEVLNQEILDNNKEIVTNAEWLDPLNLQLTADFSMFGQPGNLGENQKLMDDLVYAFASDGFHLTNKDICVTLIDSEKVTEIARKCITKENS